MPTSPWAGMWPLVSGRLVAKQSEPNTSRHMHEFGKVMLHCASMRYEFESNVCARMYVQ